MSCISMPGWYQVPGTWCKHTWLVPGTPGTWYLDQVGVPGTRKQQTTKRMHKFFSVYYYNSLTVIVQKQLEPPSLLGVTVVKGSLLVY